MITYAFLNLLEVKFHLTMTNFHFKVLFTSSKLPDFFTCLMKIGQKQI